MKIIQKAVVKEIMTNASKAKLQQSMTSKIDRAEKECEQLRFQQKKLEKQFERSTENVKGKIQQELAKRVQFIRTTTAQLAAIKEIPLGTEYTHSETETLIELEVGSAWHPDQKPVIVIEDGIVKEIRQRW
ncbi:YlqD family protein [Jeotgalibacillus soli]|uniref:YlqD protein n=1 Tax=Jeotgalibacillus soli TaxID=889306 RepID=A0A0C2V7C9_9BACL|nr:YlqD family protein [Jeotgalibacillus soli]KIL44862.1 hypothetical protein KP78_24060 [Jeotgalibacillus soli]